MKRLAALLVLLLGIELAWADLPTPPTQGPYLRDTPFEYTNLPQGELMSLVNMVVCAIGNTLPGRMVNQGLYVATVDLGTCALPAAAMGIPKADLQMIFSVLSTQASASDPQITKGHGRLQGLPYIDSRPLYFHLRTLQSATQAPPNGEFVLNLAIPTDTQGMARVRIDVSPDRVGMVVRIPGLGDLRMLVAGGADTGGGQISFAGDSLTFNYNRDAVCSTATASTAGATVTTAGGAPLAGGGGTSATVSCYSRRRDQGTLLAVAYGLYDDLAGTRLRPGGNSVNLRDPAGNGIGWATPGQLAMADGTAPATGRQLVDVDTGILYEAVMTDGLLLRLEATQVDPASIDHVVYRMDSVRDHANYELYWDDAAKRFVVTAIGNPNLPILCGIVDRFFGKDPLDCAETTPLPVPAPIPTQLTVAELAAMASSGRPVIALASNNGSAERGLYLFPTSSQDFDVFSMRVHVMAPGESGSPDQLTCTGLCPLADDLVTSTPGSTGSQGYHWDAQRYKLQDSNGVDLPSPDLLQFPWSSPDLYPAGGNGLVVYQWVYRDTPQTGFLRRSSDGAPLVLELPQQALWPVPPGYGRFSGLTLPLALSQDVGLVDLPSYRCSSPQALRGMQCNRLPQFMIADSDHAFVRVDGQVKWVRPMLSVVEFAEILATDPNFANLANELASPGVSVGGSASPADLPNPDTEDPSNSNSANYAGDFTTSLLSDKPSVVTGMKVLGP